VCGLAVVSQVNATQLDRGLVHFRSLWRYNPSYSTATTGTGTATSDTTATSGAATTTSGAATTATATASGTASGDDSGVVPVTYGHMCVSGINDAQFKEYTIKYKNIGVVLHQLHDVTLYHESRSLSEAEEWRNLLCTAQIADYYFMHNVLVMNVLFISVNFMIMADLRTTLLKRVSLEASFSGVDSHVYCMPKQVSLEPIGGTIGGMCEMDIFLMPSGIGTEFYGVLNATKPLNLLAYQALEVAARSVTSGISFLHSRDSSRHRGDMIVRDGRMWTGQESDDGSIALIEFANKFYRLSIAECHIFLSFDFVKHFNTESLFSEIFSRDLSYIQNFCDDEVLFEATDLSGIFNDNLKKRVTPAIYDLIIFNDEIELLLLRLEFLKPHVTAHILLESPTTFTGLQKPLHFQNNKDLFVGYNVIPFVLPLNSPGGMADGEIWSREYYSRNRLYDALVQLNVKDEDIILVSDVDEIPHPRALQSLLAIHSHVHVPPSIDGSVTKGDYRIHSSGYRSRIHKFHQRTYMYDFNCFLAKEGQTLSRTALTATTLGNAKLLFYNNNYDSLMTNVRMYQQHTTPYAYEDVLEPGGWHLTFFGGIQRIKSKLSSYSHRNIRRTYVTDEEDGKLDDYGEEAEKFFTLISQRIANGDQIDNRETEKCSNDVHYDEETGRLKLMWEGVISKVQSMHLS
jgi:hypothetical protein